MNVPTRELIRSWLERAPPGATHMLVLCDTFDYTDHPMFFADAESASAKAHAPGEMTRSMECYRLADDWDEQLALRRCWRF